MKGVTIRRARIADLPVICRMGLELTRYHDKHGEWQTTLADRPVLKDLRKHFKKQIHSARSLVLVAELDGDVVGYSVSWLVKRPPIFVVKEHGYVDDVYVVKKHRRKGLAKLFLDEHYSWFRKKGVKLISITWHASNALGKGAWEKYGFKPTLITGVRKI